jgi:hypothetical protein
MPRWALEACMKRATTASPVSRPVVALSAWTSGRVQNHAYSHNTHAALKSTVPRHWHAPKPILQASAPYVGKNYGEKTSGSQHAKPQRNKRRLPAAHAPLLAQLVARALPPPPSLPLYLPGLPAPIALSPGGVKEFYNLGWPLSHLAINFHSLVLVSSALIRRRIELLPSCYLRL